MFGDDDAERTMSDLPVPMEVEVVVAESSGRMLGATSWCAFFPLVDCVVFSLPFLLDW